MAHHLQSFFRLIYADCSLLRRFHADVNHDERAVVPPWNSSRRRTLTFRTPLNAPTLITNMVGSDCINVAEGQTFTVRSENCIELESIPVPQMAGASNFSSLAKITIQDDALGTGCTVIALVQVTALGPWGLTGTIESFMVTAAKDSLHQFFIFCSGYITELSSDGELQVTLQRVPQIAEIMELEPLEAEEGEPEISEFFDAEEPSGLPQIDFSGVDPAALGEVFALYLQYLSHSADETTSLLRSIDSRLVRLEEANRSGWSSLLFKLPWWESVSSKQGLLLLGVGASSAALAALMYRARTSRSS